MAPKMQRKHTKKQNPRDQEATSDEAECVGSTQTPSENKYKECNLRKQAHQWGWRVGNTAAKGFCGYAALYGSYMTQHQVAHAPEDASEREAMATLIMQLRTEVLLHPSHASNFADREWYRTAAKTAGTTAAKAAIVATHLQQTARRLIAGDDHLTEPDWMSSGCFYLAASMWSTDVFVMQGSPVDEGQWKMTRYHATNGNVQGAVKFSTIGVSEWDQMVEANPDGAWFMQEQNHTQHWLRKFHTGISNTNTGKSNSNSDIAPQTAAKAGRKHGLASRGNKTD
jgi:hypothetical protein